MGWLILWIISLIGIVGAGTVGLLTFWGFLGGLLWMLVVTFLVVWFWLVPSNIFFSFVNEGTARAVMEAGELERIIFRWKNHFMDQEDNIWDEEDWEVLSRGEGTRKGKQGTEFEKKIVREKKVKGRIFGGLFWVGWWPFKKIHTYPLRWTDFRQYQDEKTGKMIFKLQPHDEPERDFVMLKPAIYGIEVEGVETRPPERIAVTSRILTTMRVINPRKFLFVAPPTPLEDVLVKMSAHMRERMSLSVIDELITLQGQAGKIWEGWTVTKEAKKILGIGKVPGMKDEKLIIDTLPKWGIRVAKEGIEIRTFEPPPDIQKAMAEKRKQEMLQEARATETMGSIISSEAVARGKDKKEIQKEIDQDPLRRTEAWNTGKELTLKKLAMESGSYLYGEFPQATTLEGLIGLNKRMPMGKQPEAEEPVKTAQVAEPEKEKEPTPEPESEPENEIEKLLSQKEMTQEDLAKLKEVLAKVPKSVREKKGQELARKTYSGEIKVRR